MKFGFRRVFSRLVFVLLALAVVLLSEGLIPWGGKNPSSSILLSKQTERMLASIRRLDENGYLYYAEFDGDYSEAAKLLAHQLCRLAKPGCTVFACENEDGDAMVCRNYDAPHIVHGTSTGVNLILHVTGEGRYESYSGVDAAWFNEAGLPFFEGALDDGKTNLTPLFLLPFLCMDGMNECGLAAAILSVDITEDETPVKQADPEKEEIVIPLLLREILDHAATVEEAEEIAASYNLVNVSGNSYHLFVSDASGKSEVIEWRYGEMNAVETDVASNFFLGYDDAADCYYGDTFKESYVPMESDATASYRFGYGHGYARFRTVAEALFLHRVDGIAVLNEDEMAQIQASVFQTYHGGVDSQSQYAVQFNLTKKTLSVRTYFEPDSVFSFSFE